MSFLPALALAAGAVCKVQVVCAWDTLSQPVITVDSRAGVTSAAPHLQTVWPLAVGAALLAVILGGLLSSLRGRGRSRALRERIERRQDVLEAERYAKDVVDSVPAWLLVLGPDLRIRSANRSFLQYFGLGPEEVQGRPLGEIMATEDLPSRAESGGGGMNAQDVLLRVNVKGQEVKFPARIAMANLVRVMAGEPELLLVVEDLTESERLRLAARASEQRLRESEARLRALVGSIDEVVVELDQEGTYLNVWAADESLLVRPRSELIGKKLSDVLDEGLAGYSAAAIRRVLETGHPESIEYALDALGGRRWFLGRLSPVPDADGIPRTVCGLARDITERKKIEADLRASEQCYRMLFERNLAGVFRSTPAGKMLECNEAFARILGYPSPEAVLEHPAWDFYPSRADREQFVETLREARVLTNLETPLRCRDGSSVWVLENSAWIEDVNGSAVIEGTLIDFTQFRHAAEALVANTPAAEAVAALPDSDGDHEGNPDHLQ